jgi:hypothetical protein
MQPATTTTSAGPSRGTGPTSDVSSNSSPAESGGQGSHPGPGDRIISDSIAGCDLANNVIYVTISHSNGSVHTYQVPVSWRSQSTYYDGEPTTLPDVVSTYSQDPYGLTLTQPITITIDPNNSANDSGAYS